ncbi:MULTISPECIES: DUF5708 family protein [Rhodococcus]|uniref:DUF5708 family protein n=1 Tax=Rhodococcus cerastii TaxID=908616 RepID=A0ABU4CXM1_9NOCA|nr:MULTISPECIES: DUF5708 family protein [Rhodococcus]KAA0927871.1 hypothetical protein FQ188_01945 [Rhodococcus sp. ANT_H53B]MDI9925658.1 DUF5708 family protein [Rhodococcus sp. IEGM 1341]MDV6302185.1 DUF5708 family protein [Rhodococcus cerastii]MDV7988636.1 DUF5708 family protein [Rhodococcus sp. IEGM 1374]
MNKHDGALVVGIAMLIGGLVLFFAFRDVETPVIGLRQAGAVIAILGVIDIAATVVSKIGSTRPQDR